MKTITLSKEEFKQFILRNNEEIRVQIKEYKGVKYVDIRLFFPMDNTRELLPSKRGLTLRLEAASELNKALSEVLTEGGAE